MKNYIELVDIKGMRNAMKEIEYVKAESQENSLLTLITTTRTDDGKIKVMYADIRQALESENKRKSLIWLGNLFNSMSPNDVINFVQHSKNKGLQDFDWLILEINNPMMRYYANDYSIITSSKELSIDDYHTSIKSSTDVLDMTSLKNEFDYIQRAYAKYFYHYINKDFKNETNEYYKELIMNNLQNNIMVSNDNLCENHENYINTKNKESNKFGL